MNQQQRGDLLAVGSFGTSLFYSYMEMLHADLPFVRYSDCMAKLETVKRADTRENMRLLVEKLSESQLRTARKLIANEELPAVKVGRERRVLKAGIMEFFETNR